MSVPPPLPSKPAGGWFTRNWKWLIAAAVVGGVALVAAFVFSLLGALRSSDAFKGAVARVNASPAAVEVLGTPIEPGLFFSGHIQVSGGGSGKADLAIPVKGPNGDATIYVVATKSAGEWRFDRLVVEVAATKARIDLSDAPAAGSREKGRL